MGNTIGPEMSVDHGCVVQPARTVPEIDWDNLKFVETQDEEGRIEFFFFTGRGSLERTLPKLGLVKLAHHKGRLGKQYYKIAQAL